MKKNNIIYSWKIISKEFKDKTKIKSIVKRAKPKVHIFNTPQAPCE